jgi:hypothetical protein
MNDTPEIKDIDATMLTGPVRQVLDTPTAEIIQWERDLIRYINTEESSLGLYRFRGTARVHGQVRPWSVVLKAVRAPIHETEQAFWNYHRREILAYQDGLLSELPGGVLAPRCLSISEYSDAICWLWLEDIADSSNRSWSLDEYQLTARHLGQFNGAYLVGTPLPNQPWLSRHWLQGWLAHYEKGCQDTLRLVQDKDFWEHPLLKSAFHRSITDDVLRLWDNHETLLGVLDQLPQTFCHMDAYRPNLFIRRNAPGMEQAVAIDWVFAGIGVVGEEIANLLAASLIWFEYDAAEAGSLDTALFSGYVDGLREAGWKEDSRLARLGYTAACALRWGVVGLWWLRSLGSVDEQAEFEKHWEHPMPELGLQWSRTIYYVLDLAEEAYQLRRTLF